jgi:hypothetical protein
MLNNYQLRNAGMEYLTSSLASPIARSFEMVKSV